MFILFSDVSFQSILHFSSSNPISYVCTLTPIQHEMCSSHFLSLKSYFFSSKLPTVFITQICLHRVLQMISVPLHCAVKRENPITNFLFSVVLTVITPYQRYHLFCLTPSFLKITPLMKAPFDSIQTFFDSIKNGFKKILVKMSTTKTCVVSGKLIQKVTPVLSKYFILNV